jgi:hypothetical protein
MIYSKKALFLCAIVLFTNTLYTITHTERETLLAEAAEKHLLLRDLVEKIFAQDALIKSYTEKATAKINYIAEVEERLTGTPIKETYSKIPQEINDSFEKFSNKTIYESLAHEKTALTSRSLVKLYLLHAAVYEFAILLDLVKEWEETKQDLDQIFAKLDHPFSQQ